VTGQLDVLKKAIWIDLDNSPHVPLFAPIIKHYRENGIEVILTARDHSQTLELLELSGLDNGVTVVGRHYGKSKLNKIRGLLVRAKQLVSHIKTNKARIAVAVSHGSRSMVLAARWLKIPVITMYDYEFTETGIFNRFSDMVLVPDRISDKVLDEIRLSGCKRFKYPGIKEELYVRNFQSTEGFLRDLLNEHGLKFSDDKIVAVLRPPATTANYHSDKSDVLFTGILKKLTKSTDTFTVIVPRTKEQAFEISALLLNMGAPPESCFVLSEAVDGLELACAADLLISGGGTMNREAVLLGVPVYSIFAGRQGSLDSQMEDEGMITFIRSNEDVEKIVLRKRDRTETTQSNALTDRVERFVIKQINSFRETG